MTEGLVPLSKIVKASIIDTYGDIGQKYALHSHWAARSFKDLMRRSIRSGGRKALLTVNHNTQTATLPCDMESVSFVGYIKDGKRVPLLTDDRLVDTLNIETEEKKPCAKCGQDTKICNDLQVSETVNLITIQDVIYEQTIIKKLYPNGDYYLETKTPFLNLETNTVEYPTVPDKKFITNLDLQECGCLSTTPENLCTLQTYCPDVYACHFADGCAPCTVDYGGYKVFEETGLIQLDLKYTMDNLYIEYVGFLHKMNGQYYVPGYAFEAVVELTKFKSVEGKSSVSNPDKLWRWNQYLIAAGNMRKVKYRFSLNTIYNAATSVPTFNIRYEKWYEGCMRNAAVCNALEVSSVSACDVEPVPDPCCKDSQVVTYITIDLVFRKQKWIVGPGAPMNNGDTIYIIRDNNGLGGFERNIKEGSVNVIVDGVPIQEDEADQMSVHITYTAAATTITFNQPVVGDGTVGASQKVTVSYAKTV